MGVQQQKVAVVGLGKFFFFFQQEKHLEYASPDPKSTVFACFTTKSSRVLIFPPSTAPPCLSLHASTNRPMQHLLTRFVPACLGAMGLVSVKNLLEAGFQVVGFERSAYVGGLWHYTDDPETLSVLECKFRCF